jgi:hypothetical protein
MSRGIGDQDRHAINADRLDDGISHLLVIPSVKAQRHVPAGSLLVGLEDPEGGVERTAMPEESLQLVVA